MVKFNEWLIYASGVILAYAANPSETTNPPLVIPYTPGGHDVQTGFNPTPEGPVGGITATPIMYTPPPSGGGNIPQPGSGPVNIPGTTITSPILGLPIPVAGLTPAQSDQLAATRSMAEGSVWEAAGYGYIYWVPHDAGQPNPGGPEGPYILNSNALPPDNWPDTTDPAVAAIANRANQAGYNAQKALLATWGNP